MSTEPTEELLPCDQCGQSIATARQLIFKNGEPWQTVCSCGRAACYAESRQGAVEAWNAGICRTPPVAGDEPVLWLSFVAFPPDGSTPIYEAAEPNEDGAFALYSVDQMSVLHGRLARAQATIDRIDNLRIETVAEKDRRIEELSAALKWFVDRSMPIRAKFALHGPKDTADAMVGAFDRARRALSASPSPSEQVVPDLIAALRRIADAKYPEVDTLYAHRVVIDYCREQADNALQAALGHGEVK